MECSFWEFGAIIRHEKLRYESSREAANGRKFAVPSFLTSRNSGLDQPKDPVATLEGAETSARRKGWIERNGQLSDQWYEIVTATVWSPADACVYVSRPEQPEYRALVTVDRSVSFRVGLCGEQVWVDECHPERAARSLVDSLPHAPVGTETAVELASDVLADATSAAARREGDQQEWTTYELRMRDVDADDAAAAGAMTTLGERSTAHFNVAARDKTGARHIGRFAINTHRTPNGRVAIIPQVPSGQRTLLAPATPELLASSLDAYVEDVQREALKATEPARGRR